MTTSPPTTAGLKGLFFDVFGTTVDWRSTVTNALHNRAQTTLSSSTTTMPPAIHSRASALSLSDWGRFAAAWRASYYAFTASIVNATDPAERKRAYKTIDAHHLDSLRTLLRDWELEGLWNDDEVHAMSRVWHVLDPWADSAAGLRALNAAGFATCTLSNGNVGLLEDMAKHAGLEWTHVFSAEMFGTYKPDPAVYLGGASRLGVEPRECGMVAAHLGDLKAAKECGFKAIYVEREQEEGWDAEKVAEAKMEGWVDVWVGFGEEGFLTVAKKLGSAA